MFHFALARTPIELAPYVALAVCTACATAVRSDNPHNLLTALGLVLTSWQYSASPVRGKEHAVLDCLLNGFAVDMLYHAGYTAGGGRINSPSARLRGRTLGLCAAGLYALGTVANLDVDASAGWSTTATVLGPQAALGFAAYCYLMAARHLRSRFSLVGAVYFLGGFLIPLASFFEFQPPAAAFDTMAWWTVEMAEWWLTSKAMHWIFGESLESVFCRIFASHPRMPPSPAEQ
ncbi:hypothetical protein DICSQDRAFT_148605 [Dichomitus squalens LYAD-421 SS1]|uniref:Uncharacterized protein n=1 Tax=Dichomitus squalens (strain LYAD-421) TaxID=732165 RepID=R7SW96_DICSQ|nr:uncharacterized protein DICSQDRAFT_148605 [Dichomitus squalens LYAD-421 SS1]EJF59232.1 hypothetical protein DICSQDRAFT_148605 [Dichomitus squalens LYAD-421 SS1]